jgi:hypothetical protein
MLLELLASEDDGSTFLQTIRNFSANNKRNAPEA